MSIIFKSAIASLIAMLTLVLIRAFFRSFPPELEVSITLGLQTFALIAGLITEAFILVTLAKSTRRKSVLTSLFSGSTSND